MFFFKNKYDKLTREEVVSAICELERESKSIEDGILSKQGEIDELMKKGAVEKSREVKLFYAKKINALKAEREESTRRAMFLMYNIGLLHKLKNAIDDNRFFKNTAKTSLNNLLSDQKGLAKFLNDTLGTRVKAEEVLTNADETFRSVESAYAENKTIYGMSKEDDELLAMFETQAMVADEQEMFSETEKPNSGTENA